MIPEPTQDMIGAFVWRKHWIEDVLDSATPNDPCQAFHKPHSIHLECRQSQRVAQSEFRITEYLEWNVQAIGHLPLIFGCLRAQALHVGLELQ